MNLLEKKEFVDGHLDRVPKEVLENYEELFATSYTHNSVTIEGHKISYEDVLKVIKGENVETDSQLKLSIVNHYRTYQKVAELARQGVTLNEELLKDIHAMLMKDIINGGGLYRNVDIHVNGSNHTPTSYLRVYKKMDEFFYEISHYEGSPISLAAYTHLRIAKIHPFLDGNGRVARLMMNYQLIRQGYLPVSIPVERRKEYFDLLENYKMNKQQEPFDQFVAELVEAEYDRLILVVRTLQ